MAFGMEDFSKLLTGAGSLYELFGSGPYSIKGSTEAAAKAADPFASQRSQYQTMLQALMTNPNSFALSPAAQSQMDIGLQNVARQGAAAGFLNSGNMLGALQRYAQQLASQDFWKQQEALAMLSGAQTGSPAQAGMLRSQAYPRYQEATRGIGQSLSGVSSLLNALPGISGGISDIWKALSGSDFVGPPSDLAGSGGLEGFGDWGPVENYGVDYFEAPDLSGYDFSDVEIPTFEAPTDLGDFWG